MNLWLQFVFLAVIVLFSAGGLVNSSQKIAKKRGWADLWTGFLLLSIATSLPELFTSVNAVIVIKAPDISFGNLLGSVVFNILIVALIDIAQGSGPILREVDDRVVLLGGICTGLGAIVALGITSGLWGAVLISPFSIILLFAYFTGSRLVYANGRGPVTSSPVKTDASGMKLCWLKYCFFAAVIFAASIFLVRTVDALAVETGLGRTFFGTFFLAAATSLPEMATTIGPVRKGAYNMALGNILGSNMFNLALIFFTDLFYLDGNVFADVASSHAVTAVLGILMTGAVIIGIIYKSKKSIGFLGWDSIVIAASYIAGGYMLYILR